ncbi:MAG TPA: hypothetical protein VEQ13_03025 [Methylomirabilota bacterium]|nr:hypothetical protein [Methylomirabilota bacterium]
MSATSVEDMFQEIGREALAVAGDDLAGRLLVYAEVEDRVISTNLLYKNRQGDVRLLLSPRPLDDLVYDLWQRWKAESGYKEWRVMSYIVDDLDVDNVDKDAKMTIELTYPEDVDVEEDVSDRRPRAVKKYFGDVKVVWTDPFA